MIDLHTHSTASDGTDSPQALFQAAERAGLSAIALTDHNTIDGVPAFLAAAKGSQTEAIAGIEYSTEYQGVELHILALFVSPVYFSQISQEMADLRHRKAESNKQLILRLRERGYDISYEELQKKYHADNLNRAHIAATLAEKGFVPDIRYAFDHLLSERCGLYVPTKRPDAYDTILSIRKMGAVPVLAHPFLQFKTEDTLSAFLPRAIDSGLVGMEVYYPLYDKTTTEMASRVAKAYGLLSSGGSDYHGKNKPDILLGKGKGNLDIPDAWLEALKTKIISN